MKQKNERTNSAGGEEGKDDWGAFDTIQLLNNIYYTDRQQQQKWWMNLGIKSYNMSFEYRKCSKFMIFFFNIILIFVYSFLFFFFFSSCIHSNVCFQQLTKADRQKTADIRQLKDSYEQQLAHGNKSSKIEVHRLVSVLCKHSFIRIMNNSIQFTAQILRAVAYVFYYYGSVNNHKDSILLFYCAAIILDRDCYAHITIYRPRMLA